MIQELQIKNFRNLASLTIPFNNSCTIISGKNELGKSNALNALMWLLTGTILTDKWGTGENDIDSIVPKTAIKGINPEVTIVTKVGTTLSKKYITKYSKDGTKVTGHTTEYYMNGVACRNEDEWNEAMNSCLNFRPKVKSKGLKEKNLFIDPLYALQKLDAKELRSLLVELGCSVTDEELYQMGFEDLRPYGEKYMGKWDVFRKDLKTEVLAITKEIENLQVKIETTNDAAEYDESVLKELENTYNELISKKVSLKDLNINPDIAELEKKKVIVETEMMTKKSSHHETSFSRKKVLELQRETAIHNAEANKVKQIEPLWTEIKKLELELEKVKTDIKAYDQTIENSVRLQTSYKNLGKDKQSQKNDYSVKLDEERSKKYQGMITCPYCGSEFVGSDEDLRKFESERNIQISNFIRQIDACDKALLEYRDNYKEQVRIQENAAAQKEINLKKQEELNNQIYNLQLNIDSIEAQKVDYSEVEKINKEISEIEKNIFDDKGYLLKIEDLNNKINELKKNDLLTIQNQLNDIEIQMSDITGKIQNEYINRSKYNERQDYLKTLDETRKKLNNNEALLARCNSLIQTMISMINEKAIKRTGMHFVMLEENLSNDGIKEVCYATVDGIPFKDLNTAKKLKYGVIFIDKIKELLGSNELPILADRMEGIDKASKISELTKSQLICTRVTEDEKITII